MGRALLRLADALGTTVLLLAVQAYRILFPRSMLSTCRFHPSCSQYAWDALRRYGVWHGALRAARRLLRCRPGNGFEHDPA